MADKILIIDRIEDVFDKEEIVGKEVFDKTGESVKVKIGQGGHLKARWDELQAGMAYSFTMGEFKPPGKDVSFPYVKDFKKVEDEFVIKAAEKVADSSEVHKTRGVALRMATDIHVARMSQGKTATASEVIATAVLFEAYIANGAIVEKKKEE